LFLAEGEGDKIDDDPGSNGASGSAGLLPDAIRMIRSQNS
jgi:hypothetical protein